MTKGDSISESISAYHLPFRQWVYRVTGLIWFLPPSRCGEQALNKLPENQGFDSGEVVKTWGNSWRIGAKN